MDLLKKTFLVVSLILILSSNVLGQSTNKVKIHWNENLIKGDISVKNGELKDATITKGRGNFEKNRFTVSSPENKVSIVVEIDNINNEPGPGSTIVSVATNKHPFSFFLRDIDKSNPIYVPNYNVIVTPASLDKSYTDVKNLIQSKNLSSKLEQIKNQPEESFQSVKDKVRDMSVPIWLGISRDVRLFELADQLPGNNNGGEAFVIKPQMSSTPNILPETDNSSGSYIYSVGRGVGIENNISRTLEERTLPIYHSKKTDDDIIYHTKSFASYEKSSLNEQSIKGTNFLVADSYSGGHMFTKDQQEIVKEEKEEFLNNNDEEIVLYSRTSIKNTGSVPRYAWIKAPRPGTGWHHSVPYKYDSNSGFSFYSSNNKVFCVSKLDGVELPNEEMAILLQPGETTEFEFYMPHSPISKERARNLKNQSFDKKFEETRTFWTNKLDKAAKIQLPDKRVEEMIQAGLLHLDLITYGKEPDGTLAPTIGVYSPIGTESAPIIQFYASMGWEDIAKRSLQYFLDKQHKDGFIQNFGGYMVETGAALWSMGEYYRYTNDTTWVSDIKNKLIKSSDYLINWRNDNKIDSLRGKGYGMIDGKVADPEDPFRQFMLNGYGYLGLSRVAEMLNTIAPNEASRFRKEAEAWREDIRQTFFNAMALSPVVPLGDGTWSPTAPPWPSMRGPRALYTDEETFWSHGTFTTSDVLLGPLYLVFTEVLDTDEPESKMLLKYTRELFLQGNSAFSQPYYSRHNWLQAKFGMVKPFLNTYYSTFAALADRETYTFWEHLYKVSPHKTHEEAWFLMQTRWMLYMEEGNTLNLLKTIPRRWMKDGKKIELNNVQSYFGPINLSVKSHLNDGYIEAEIICEGNEKPETVKLRVPHPQSINPEKVEGGVFNEDTETIIIESFTGQQSIRLEY